jgi:hypothetical protein
MCARSLIHHYLQFQFNGKTIKNQSEMHHKKKPIMKKKRIQDVSSVDEALLK